MSCGLNNYSSKLNYYYGFNLQEDISPNENSYEQFTNSELSFSLSIF